MSASVSAVFYLNSVCVCVCVCIGQKLTVCVGVCVCIVKKGECLRLCLCRDSVCVCVCVFEIFQDDRTQESDRAQKCTLIQMKIKK